VAAALGAAAACAALTRSEGAALLVLIGGPAIAWWAPDRRRAIRLALAAVGAFAVLMAPWQIRNLMTFDRFVPITTTSGSLLAGSNCDGTYRGPTLGLWRLDCVIAAEDRIAGRLGPQARREDESVRGARLGTEGKDYIRHHRGRLPVVVAVRVLRTWDFYRPRDQAAYETFEGRHLRVEQAGVAIYYLLLPFVAFGAWVLWRRDRRLLGLLAIPCVLVTIVSATGYGVTRFRSAAEPSLVLLAAVGMTSAAATLRSRRRAAVG
jgi:hypothetical protein